MVLKFPAEDLRSSGKPLSKSRPWLFNGAVGVVVRGSKKLREKYHYTTPIHFEGSPKGEYDLVSSEFLKQPQTLPREAIGA